MKLVLDVALFFSGVSLNISHNKNAKYIHLVPLIGMEDK